MKSLKRYRKTLGVLAGSLPLFAVIDYWAFWLRFDGQLAGEPSALFWSTLPWVLAIKAICFLWSRVYQGWNRFATFYDLLSLAQASVASSFCLVLVAYLVVPGMVIPRSVFLMDCLGTVVLFGAFRATGRVLTEWRAHRTHRTRRIRALIVGANESAETLLRAIRTNPKLNYHVVGCVRHPAERTVDQIARVPVVGDTNAIQSLAVQFDIREILIMADECAGREVRKIVEQGVAVGVQVKVLPSYEQLLHSRVDLKPRTVSIQDLLRRDPVKLDMRGLHQWIDGRVLMVTGSAGSIGSEICRQLLQFDPRRIILVDRSENGQFFLQRELADLAPHLDLNVHVADCGDARRMEELFREYQPNIVFHAAAYKHVPLMEQEPGEAVKNIVLTTQVMADLSQRHQVDSFVMISTDKAVNPTSVMGASKRVAEMYVQALSQTSDCRFVTVRFGNVLDSAGSVVPIFREQIARGGPVTVTHPDMQRYFMMIPEASQLVIQAGAMGQGGEIFVLDMGKPVRIVDLAEEMIELSGLKVGRDIEIHFTGIRPGEKLFEELHNANERHAPTVHPKILVAHSARMELAAARTAVSRLELASRQSSVTVRQILREIVPHYRFTPALPDTAPPLHRAA